MTWFVRKIVDLFSALADFYYSRKYAAIADQMGRPHPAVTVRRRGFIVIQIDGLAYPHLKLALERGYMPYLRRLLERGRLRLALWRCGLPSTTPAVQAGIMYGDSYDIPGFRWYEKESNASVVTKLPGSARALQRRLAQKRPGILGGGSSYVNMFDGGARLSIFTLSTLNGQRFFESVRGVGFFLLLLLSPTRVLRIVYLSLWEYLRDLVKRLIALLIPGYHRPFEVVSPFLMLFTSVIFREIQTFGILVDIYRGVPAIYTNYYSYDEYAHHFGPTHPEALRTLRGIDKQIRQIVRMCTQYRRREYDLYILSDHGQTPSVPFEKAYGCTLGQFIARQVETGLMDEQWDGEQATAAQVQFLLEELKGIEARLSRRGAALVRRARQYLADRFPLPLEEEETWDLSRRGDIVVRSSGSLSHVYFNVVTRPMNLSEVAMLYSNLLKALIEHPGIGLVVGREGQETVVMGEEGTLVVHPDGEVEVRGQNPLASYPEPEWAIRHLHHLCSFPHSGDLILLGAWRVEEGEITEVVCFEDQVGSHGGLGGPQDYPFIAYPAHLELHPERWTGPQDLYWHFVSVRRTHTGLWRSTTSS